MLFGIFYPFVQDTQVGLIGVEAAGKGLDTNKHAATFNRGTVGIIHGMKTYLLQSPDGEITEPYSVAAGLDYPGVGPEHSYLKDIGRAKYESATDEEALAAFELLSRVEGIIPALESSHALAYANKTGAKAEQRSDHHCEPIRQRDKDVQQVAKMKGIEEI